MKKIIIPQPYLDMIINLPTLFYNFNCFLNQAQKSFSNIDMLGSNEFKLFYYLNENYINDISYILQKDFDSDVYGFIPVWRNARNSTETLLDLYNLVYTPNYLQVLKKQEPSINLNFKNMDKELLMYVTRYTKEKKMYYTQFDIRIKSEIARAHGYNGEALPLIENKSEIEIMNRYVHSSIFIEPNFFDDNKKLETAKYLLTYELTLYFEAFHLLQEKFGKDYPLMPYYTLTFPVRDVVGLFNFQRYFDLCRKAINEASLPKPYDDN